MATNTERAAILRDDRAPHGLLRMTVLFVAAPASHGLVSHPRGEGVPAADAARSAGAMNNPPVPRRGAGAPDRCKSLTNYKVPAPTLPGRGFAGGRMFEALADGRVWLVVVAAAACLPAGGAAFGFLRARRRVAQLTTA